jgi:regulator of RNase E activity RraB
MMWLSWQILCDLQNDLEIKAAVLKHLQESLDALSNKQLVSYDGIIVYHL